MKHTLLIILLIIILAGCTIPEIIPEPESPIVCEGGHYSVRFRDWQTCGCPSCEVYEKGTYWVNSNGRMFLLGEPILFPYQVYGKCPSDYIYEIEL
jgi:hypothetical protein